MHQPDDCLHLKPLAIQISFSADTVIGDRSLYLVFRSIPSGGRKRHGHYILSAVLSKLLPPGWEQFTSMPASLHRRKLH